MIKLRNKNSHHLADKTLRNKNGHHQPNKKLRNKDIHHQTDICKNLGNKNSHHRADNQEAVFLGVSRVASKAVSPVYF